MRAMLYYCLFIIFIMCKTVHFIFQKQIFIFATITFLDGNNLKFVKLSDT